LFLFRFDVRANLDFIPDYKSVTSVPEELDYKVPVLTELMLLVYFVLFFKLGYFWRCDDLNKNVT
jgi:hypothetical protein